METKHYKRGPYGKRKDKQIENLTQLQEDVRTFKELIKDKYPIGKYRSYTINKLQDVIDTTEKQIRRNDELFNQKKKLEKELEEVNKKILESNETEEILSYIDFSENIETSLRELN